MIIHRDAPELQVYSDKLFMARKANAGNVSPVLKGNESNCFTLSLAFARSVGSVLPFLRLNNVRKEGKEGGREGAAQHLRRKGKSGRGRKRERSRTVRSKVGRLRSPASISLSLSYALGVRHFNTDYRITLLSPPPPVSLSLFCQHCP